MAVSWLVVGAASLLFGGYLTSSLVASIAEPVSILLAVAAGGLFFAQAVREDYMQLLGVSSEGGEVLSAATVAIGLFFIVFVTSQAIITALSPLAGLIVVGLGVALFFLPNGVIFQVIGALIGDN